MKRKAKQRQAQEQARRIEAEQRSKAEDETALLLRHEVSPPLQQRSPSGGATYPSTFGSPRNLEEWRTMSDWDMRTCLNARDYMVRQAHWMAELKKLTKN